METKKCQTTEITKFCTTNRVAHQKLSDAQTQAIAGGFGPGDYNDSLYYAMPSEPFQNLGPLYDYITLGINESGGTIPISVF